MASSVPFGPNVIKFRLKTTKLYFWQTHGNFEKGKEEVWGMIQAEMRKRHLLAYKAVRQLCRPEDVSSVLLSQFCVIWNTINTTNINLIWYNLMFDVMDIDHTEINMTQVLQMFLMWNFKLKKVNACTASILEKWLTTNSLNN